MTKYWTHIRRELALERFQWLMYLLFAVGSFFLGTFLSIVFVEEGTYIMLTPILTLSTSLILLMVFTLLRFLNGFQMALSMSIARSTYLRSSVGVMVVGLATVLLSTAVSYGIQHIIHQLFFSLLPLELTISLPYLLLLGLAGGVALLIIAMFMASLTGRWGSKALVASILVAVLPSFLSPVLELVFSTPPPTNPILLAIRGSILWVFSLPPALLIGAAVLLLVAFLFMALSLLRKQVVIN